MATAAVARLCREHEALWAATPEDPPVLGPPVARPRQQQNAREAERLLDEVAAAVLECPEDDEGRLAWRRRLEARVREFGSRQLGWPDGYQDLLFADEYYRATVDFVREARRFDAGVRPDEVGQALRNVWIGNSLQMLLELPVRLSPSLFGYSMLYPWTDNLLDDPGLTQAAKAAFNLRLGARLAGGAVRPEGRHERQVFELVARVESEHERRQRPDVYDSLLAIHRAQVASLRQQQPAAAMGRGPLLAIAVEKGGTSVLADLHLVAPSVGEAEAAFAFGYGVFLQMLDDLQDVRADTEKGHATLFSTAAAQGLLDSLVGRLCRFVDRVTLGSGRFASPEYGPRLDLVRRNCRLLLVGAVAEQERLFSRVFVRSLEERWPFDFASMRQLRREAQRRYRRTLSTLQRRRGVRSLLELVA
ncbi:MAG TPA: hypothetical protein VEQ10_00945 [Vicinamibacteria bacterium]|nr:hypothetical protein [Vicinamibacteria bacterium]